MTPQSSIAHYRIVSKLGEGGMGAVYRATDTKLNRDVAIKVLPASLAGDAQYMARFEREAQMLAAMNHPNIATIYGVEQGALIMELVEGVELSGPLPLEEVLPIARQIALGLEAAHERGVIHRDLKPANIKLTPAGLVKILDFGLAKTAGEFATPRPGSATMSPTLSLAMTQAGMVLGTAAYMAPEQARGHAVDRRADIWAFGAVLFELLTGKPAFPGDTVTDILASVVKLEPDWSILPASTPPAIRKLLTRCLVKDRQRRLQSIGEARLAIEDYLADPAADAAPAAVPVLPPPARRPWVWMAVSGILLAALASVSLVHWRETPPPEHVFRYTISPPEKSQIQSFALSPDGRYLAIAAAVEGKRQLWLRPLDTLALQELRGTEDATLPFWSPDSRSIGFFAGGKLKRTGVDGSPPLVLCDARPPVRGATWSADGTILFGGGNSRQSLLQKVSAAGGVPVVVQQDQVPRYYPSFLPDGRRYLYVVSLSGESQNGVYLGSLDGQPSRRLLTDDSTAFWLPPLNSLSSGHLVFWRHGSLLVQPMDDRALQPSGEPFPIAESVGASTSNYVQASISRTGVLVYWSGGLLNSGQLTWYDRSGKAQGTPGAPSTEIGLALSPDEKIVAVARGKARNRNDSDLWFHELARGLDTRFTMDSAGGRTPVWSPDGRRMVYSAIRETSSNLYLRDTSGTGKDERLLPPAGSRFPTDWSKDGRVIVWEETGKGYDLWSMSMDGERKPVPFANSEFNETQGQLSPDSRWLAYASDESGRYEVYVRPFPSGEGKFRISVNGGELPRWRGDGKEIYFVSPDRKMMAAVVKATPGVRPAIAAEPPQTLFDMHMSPFTQGFNNYPYAVTADGKRFLVISGIDAPETPLNVVVNWLAAVKK